MDLNQNISHLHGPADVIESALETVRRDLGVELSFDSYPYLRGNTILARVCTTNGGTADHGVTPDD
ncbi:hypothetical protein [Streptomyces sp. WMMB 322]|uniref:hypothetical protein n=1 Tax=Streptomyces sp. WMMB 322 TaxID=1286821 RepID=UPI0011130E83|nr:hypothetical protein [Streptomyces sp. WMMB 322]